MPPTSPSEITGTGFNGDQSLTRNEIGKLILQSGNQATSLIPNYNGKIVCTVVLHLRNNNQTIDQSQVFLSGNLFEKEKAFRSNSFWGLPDVSLIIGPLSGASFSFPPGALASNYLDFTNIPHKLVRKDEQLSPEEATELNIPGFCLRLLLQPIAQDWLNFTLLLFPLPRAHLLTSIPDATHTGFPGIKLWPATGRPHCSIPLHPQTEGVFPGKRWGCPIAPGLVPGAPWEEVEGCPSVRDLRGAIFYLLRSATVANFEKDGNDLASRWAAIKADSNALSSCHPLLLWPVPPQPPAPTSGRSNLFFFLSFFFRFS